MVSTSRLERTGGRRASSNGLEESQALPRWQSCKENLFVLLPRQRLWMGGEGGERGKLARGRGKERKIGQKRESENKWMMREEGEGMMSCCTEIWARASLFTPSLPCLCWMILNCVGEFTVFCNLIPNKVTQQILLSRLDAAAVFFFFGKRQLKQDTIRKCFLYRLCFSRLGTELCWSNPTLFFYTCICFSLLHPLPLLSSLFLLPPPRLCPFFFLLWSWQCGVPHFFLFSFWIVTSEHLLEAFW